MPYLLPFVMLFGFLSMHVRHDGNFDVVMPFVLVAMTGWSFLEMWRNASAATRGFSVAAVLLGIAMLSVFALCGVVEYEAVGPMVLGAPLALAIVWAALVFMASAVVTRLTTSWRLGLLAATVIALVCALVIDPAAFALGLFSYHANGLYYSVPFIQTAFWSVSVAIGVAAAWWSAGQTEAVQPLGAVRGALLLLGYATGVCVAAGMWVPAILGLVLSQLGLRALYYL